MPYEATVYRVFIAGPSDVEKDKGIICACVDNCNRTLPAGEQVLLRPVMWKTDARPEMGGRPQELLNKQLVDSCDLLICTFWTRMGTPTGLAPSGSVEEIQRFVEAGKPVMLYFSSKPIKPGYDQEQYNQLCAFRSETEQKALVWDYSSSKELHDRVTEHLAPTVRSMVSADTAGLYDGGVPTAVASVVVRFAATIRRYELEWSAEQEGWFAHKVPCRLYDFKDARDIMRRLGQELLDLYTAMHDEMDERVIRASDIRSVEGLARTAKRLEKSNLSVPDYQQNDYWQQGSKLFHELKKLQDRWQKATA